MASNQQRIADLERQLAEPAAEMKHLRADALCLRTLGEMMVRQAYGYSPVPGSAQTPRVRRVILEEMARSTGPARRSRNLLPVDGESL
jgi:hypothetical protein